MSQYTEHDDLSARERALFDQLPRAAGAPAGEADRIVGALREEGFLRRRRPVTVALLQAAAGLALVAGGAVIGARYERAGSLEGQLARADLSVNDRVYLLQRAGSAYVRAAHAYAQESTGADSMAVEVASRVLIGAASAVARSGLRSPLSTDLVSVIQAAETRSRPLLRY